MVTVAITSIGLDVILMLQQHFKRRLKALQIEPVQILWQLRPGKNLKQFFPQDFTHNLDFIRGGMVRELVYLAQCLNLTVSAVAVMVVLQYGSEAV